MNILLFLLIGICIILIINPKLIAEKISQDSRKVRIWAGFCVPILLFSGLIFRLIYNILSAPFLLGITIPILLLYLSIGLFIYLLFNPHLLPDKTFPEGRKKKPTNVSDLKKRLFICAILLGPIFFINMFVQSDIDEKESSEWALQAEEQRKEQEALEVAERKQLKIKTLEALGVSNVFLLSEKEHDLLIDSIDNKNCREKWLKKLADDYGIYSPNLRKRTDNYNVNKDCDLASELHTEIYFKQWEKKRKSEAVSIWTLLKDYRNLGVLNANNKYAKSNFDLKNCRVIAIDEWSSWTGYTIHLAAGESSALNCNMDYDKTEGAEILGKLRIGSIINLNSKVAGDQVDIYTYSMTIRLENGKIW